jgi:arylsulfatase A-like enzyme
LRAVRKQVLAQRWPWLVAAGIVVAMLAISVEFRPTGVGDPRPRGTAEDIKQLRNRKDLNVLFILIDTLRAERMSSYGNPRETTPALDRLASAGVRFEHQMSQSTWTKASMASIWTGLYPAHTGITRYDDVIPDVARMPAEILHDAGFKTFGLWRNGWVAPTFGFDQGFDVYQRPIATPLAPKLRIENPTLNDRGTDQSLIDAGIEFLRVNGRQRWFLYLHLMDLHEYIYDADSALFGSSHSDIYDNSIRWTDDSLSTLLDTLSELGLADKTIVVVLSDHGEAFLERGAEGHARDVYRETTEVPLLISFPFRLDPGAVVKVRTRNVDVWPTIFDLLGLEIPKGIDGRSLLPDILASVTGQAPDDAPRTSIADLDQNWSRRDSQPQQTVAVVEDPFRYVRVTQADGAPRIEQLFDSRDDPREFRDRSAEQKETFERLRAKADDYVKEKPAWGEAPTREMSELELNLLRALGYKVP